MIKARSRRNRVSLSIHPDNAIYLLNQSKSLTLGSPIFVKMLSSPFKGGLSNRTNPKRPSIYFPEKQRTCSARCLRGDILQRMTRDTYVEAFVILVAPRSRHCQLNTIYVDTIPQRKQFISFIFEVFIMHCAGSMKRGVRRG